MKTCTQCGADFGLKVYRHRLFESNIWLYAPWHESHGDKTPSAGHGLSPKGSLSVTGGGHGIRVARNKRERKALDAFLSPKGFISVSGHFSQTEYARAAMGVDWYVPQNKLKEGIPPAYTEFLGAQLISYLLGEPNEAMQRMAGF